ncbi:D-alanine--D-alanine ligase [Nymphon striatum]|nr:D-alanine--D-alanine ligase [Nymphon striatum]
MGGYSSEHNISIKSGNVVHKYLDAQKFESYPHSYHQKQMGDVIDENAIIEKVGLPCFVKANKAGSSFGISKSAIENAYKEDDEIIIEAFLDGTEVSVGVIKFNGQTKVLPITEIVTENDFFDYEAKYEGKSKEITPARISEAQKEKKENLHSITMFSSIRDEDTTTIRQGHKNGLKFKTHHGTDDQENVIGTILQSEDVTNTILNEGKLEKLEILSEQMADLTKIGLWDYNLERNEMLLRNIADLQMPDEILGKDDFDTYDKETAEKSRKNDLMVMRELKPILAKEMKLTKIDGSSTTFLTSKIPLIDTDGHAYGLIGISLDISDLKRKEIELRQLIKVTASQNEKLVNFAHIVSHNLRSHSANFAMLLNFLKTEESESEKNRITNMLFDSSNNLMETLENLNDVVDINTKRGTSHPDRDPIYELESSKEGKYTILSIKDNGLGIDLNKYGDKLFGMYKTFHDHAGARGIGLYITKNQIEAMKGKVSVINDDPITVFGMRKLLDSIITCNTINTYVNGKLAIDYIKKIIEDNQEIPENKKQNRTTNFSTHFEATDGTETATYDQVIDFYLKLAREYSEINIQTVGETDSGYPLHLVTYNPDGNFDFKKIANTKATILINNGIHPW